MSNDTVKPADAVGSSEGLGLEPERALLAAFDTYARTLVQKPHHMTPEMWPKGWPFFAAGWAAAVAAERERWVSMASDMATNYRRNGLAAEADGLESLIAAARGSWA